MALSSPLAGPAATPAQQAYLKASNTEAGDRFGYVVAVSGDTLVIGSPDEDSNATGVNGNQSNNSATDSGAAYVLVRTGTNWTQQAYLKASNTGPQNGFGVAVAISGDTIVIGGGESSGAGAAYVFVRNGTTWTQQAYLKASNAGANDFFGISAAISGDTVVIGAIAEDSNATGVNGNQSDNSAPDAGAGYVFVRSGANWSQQAYLKPSNTRTNHRFGISAAISGDTVVIGADGESSGAIGVNGNQYDNSAPFAGAAYVFVRHGTNWSQQAYLKASKTGGQDYFGCAVAIASDTIVVGAPGEDSNATGINGNQSNESGENSGAAYVFGRNGTNWSQQAYLKGSNTEAYDDFGVSVAVSGETIVVGADEESSGATGVNGDQSDNSVDSAGAAYVFVRTGTDWSQQAYLKAFSVGAPSPGEIFGDEFGRSVAVSGDTVVVTAVGEDSSATGVNGNQSDNGARQSGSGYVFTGLGIGPSLALTSDGRGGYFLRLNGAPDVTYRLERAPNVTGPWNSIATNTTPASGFIEFHETTQPAGQAFYRNVQP
jgi:hypothetical protein